MSSPALARHRTMRRPTSPAPPLRVVGHYRYEPSTEAWWWSPEMFAVHGVPPGPTPDGDSLLRYQHADDRGRMAVAISAACSSAQSFVLETRVVRPDGGQRSVVLTGEPAVDPGTGAITLEGTCIDVTGCRAPGSEAERIAALETEVEQLRAAMASRATIEQAKGILMLLTSCGDQVAFDLLAHISSHTHRKVRDVATSIIESAAGRTRLPDDVRTIIRDACPPASA